MSPLSILLYITPSSLGGAENAVMQQARELRKRGHQVLFACPRGRRLTKVLQDEGYEVWAPRTSGKLDPLTMARLVGLIRTRRIQVVHTHLSTASLLGSFAARLARVPAIATVHGLNSAFCYRFSRRVIAVSAAVRDHLVRQELPVDRIQVIYNGVDLDHYRSLPDRSSARSSLDLGAGDQVLLYAGRLSPEKGVLLLPPLLERVRQRLPGVILLVAGDGLLRTELDTAFQVRGQESNARLLGFQADVRPLLAAADLLVAPSYREGLPLILVEAMVAGLPTVGTTAGGIPEAIQADITGKLVPVGDMDAMAEACFSLLTNTPPGQRDAIVGAARNRVEKLFSIQHTVTELEKVYRSLLRPAGEQ